MNREIKFRVWNTENRCWLDLSSHKLEETSRDELESDNTFTLDSKVNVFQQYTGVNDKNGINIFEGDILTVQDTDTEHILDDGSGPTYDFYHLCPVVFEMGRFGVEIIGNGDHLKNGEFYTFSNLDNYVGTDEINVIGNIFDNPELIERK